MIEAIDNNLELVHCASKGDALYVSLRVLTV